MDKHITILGRRIKQLWEWWLDVVQVCIRPLLRLSNKDAEEEEWWGWSARGGPTKKVAKDEPETPFQQEDYAKDNAYWLDGHYKVVAIEASSNVLNHGGIQQSVS